MRAIVYSQYYQTWQRRFAAAKAEALARAERARAELPQAVAILRRHGAKRIILFGSLCRPERFHERSDIDLAASGIPAEKFMRASADLMMAIDHPTDLKPWEELDDFFREMILKRGEVLYEE